MSGYEQVRAGVEVVETSTPGEIEELLRDVGEPVVAGLTLTSDQSRALDALVRWWDVPEERERQYLTLGGYAGTGKTTLVAALCRALPEVRVHFCAFTAKAASVLRASLRSQGLAVTDGKKPKGGRRAAESPAGGSGGAEGGAGTTYPVTTIHGLLYAPLEQVWCRRSGELLGDADGETPRARRCSAPGCAVQNATLVGHEDLECPPLSQIEWSRKLGGPAADLVVLDEASMVSREAWEDILSLGLPVLAVGDHGQLPPVKSQFALLRDGVDLELTQITRQGKDSAIIALASEVRLGPVLPGGSSAAYGVRDSRPNRYVAKIASSQMGQLPPSLGDGTDPVWICGYNRTRATWNELLRRQRGLSGRVTVGDRVICLKNSLRTYNGQLARVLKVTDADGRPGVVELELEPEEPLEREALGGAPLVVQVPLEQFGRTGTLTTDDLVQGGYRGCGLWDFGYVLTCHKAQGSTFSNVVVLEEVLPGGAEAHRKWLYTAITRARYSVVVIK